MYIIQSKLRGIEIPDVLPASLLLSGNAQGGNPPSGAFGQSAGVISPEDRSKYHEYFKRADVNNTNFVTAEQAKKLFSLSKLPPTDLAKIW